MIDDPVPTRSNLARVGRVAKWIATSIAFVGITMALGIGMVAALGLSGDTSTWIRWSNIGQAFGALNSVLSGFAIVALVITILMQFQELRAQRAELAIQRESWVSAQAALHRSVDAQFRMAHVDLLKMAIDDEQLARVWPVAAPDLPYDRARQHLYANLILQHVRTVNRAGELREEDLRGTLRFLFKSPLIREFWEATVESRTSMLRPDSLEWNFTKVADEVLRE